MAVTQQSDLNGLFNTIYERAKFVARERNLMAALVDNRSATGWMNRVVPIRPTISAVTVEETEDFSAPTTFGLSTKATLTPGEIIAQVVLTDRDMDTDPNGAVNDATFELGGAMATKVDEDLVGLFASFTETKGDGAGNTATLENLAAAVSVLGYNKARQFGVPNIVLHPYHWHDVWVELGKPSTNVVASDVANQALKDYYVSDMLACRWYTSANIAIDGSADAVSGLFVTPAIMLDTRRAPRMETERDASARAYEINMTAGYAYGIVHQEYGVNFTADATEPA